MVVQATTVATTATAPTAGIIENIVPVPVQSMSASAGPQRDDFKEIRVTVQKSESVSRADLHQLIDAIPADSLGMARDSLKPFIDPVLFAFLTAPVDDEEWTEEDLAAIAEGEADLAAGRTYSLEEVRARLLGDG